MDEPVLAPLIGSKTSERFTGRNPQTAATTAAPASEESGGKKRAGVVPAADAPKKKSSSDLINRTVFTLLMAYVFLSAISLGIVFGVPLVQLIQVTMFHEITRINQRVRKERRLPSLNIIKWYFYSICTIYALVYTLREPITSTFPAAEFLYSKLAFLGFSAVILGIMIFVLSLRKGMYRYQFMQFTWTAMTLLFIVTQCSAELRNMMRGMIWFLLPVTCVVQNDIWAYLFGKMFGRTKLLALSPKKTVEGFLGAFLFTVLWSFWFCGFLGYFPEMYCPAVGFTSAVNAGCEKDPLFVQTEVKLPGWMQAATRGRLTTMLVSPAQRHAVVLGVFGSLVAPFGGFFASGLKRAFKLKDFGDLIPGHGGMTDRMDCQGLMGLFTYFYLRTYVYNAVRCPSSFEDVMSCAMQLSAHQRQELTNRLLSSL